MMNRRKVAETGKNPDPETPGQTILRLRKEKGLSPWALARSAGLSAFTLWELERDQGPALGAGRVKRLAAALEVPPGALLPLQAGGSRKKGPSPEMRRIAARLRSSQVRPAASVEGSITRTVIERATRSP